MASNKVTQNIGYYEVGTSITLNVDFVKNNGPDIATGVEVEVTIPTGLVYNTSSLEQGTFAGTTWTVGSLIPGQTVSATFTFDVTDDCEGPWSVDFVVSTQTGCDSCLDNNTLCVVTSGISCCELSPCHGKVITPVSAVSYNALLTDNVILADSSSNAVAIVLPTEASAFNSDTNKSLVHYHIKCVDITTGVDVTATGKIVDNTDLAGATTSFSFSTVGESIELVTDGTNWFII